MAAYASLISLTTVMGQIQNHHRLSKSLDMNQIESLHEKLHFLLNFIEINSHLLLSKQGEVMETLIAFAANAAEDLIESHVADQIHGFHQAEGYAVQRGKSIQTCAAHTFYLIEISYH